MGAIEAARSALFFALPFFGMPLAMAGRVKALINCGDPCSKQTVGLLQRRHIRVEQIKYIGKESNALEDVESGLIHSEQSVYTEYPDPRRDEWQTKILPASREISLKELAKKSGMSRSALKEIRAGHSRPHPNNQKMLAAMLQEMHDPKGKEQQHAVQKSRTETSVGTRTPS